MRGVGLDYEELDNGHFSISSYDGSGWPEIPDDEDDEREDEDQFPPTRILILSASALSS